MKRALLSIALASLLSGCNGSGSVTVGSQYPETTIYMDTTPRVTTYDISGNFEISIDRTVMTCQNSHNELSEYGIDLGTRDVYVTLSRNIFMMTTSATVSVEMYKPSNKIKQPTGTTFYGEISDAEVMGGYVIVTEYPFEDNGIYTTYNYYLHSFDMDYRYGEGHLDYILVDTYSGRSCTAIANFEMYYVD